MHESIDREEAEKRFNECGKVIVDRDDLLDILFPPKPREFWLNTVQNKIYDVPCSKVTCSSRWVKVREIIE